MINEKLPKNDDFSEKQAAFVMGQALLPRTDLPLGRFLSPYIPGQASDWVGRYAPAGSWILDPFGQDPFADLELAKAGYRVLVAANNPVAAFILEMIALGADHEEWADALLAVSDLRVNEDQNFKNWLAGFYNLPCPNPSCRFEAQVERFIWSENEAQSGTAEIHCPTCGLRQIITLGPDLNLKFNQLPRFSLYRARALELTSAPTDELRPVMEDVIQYYTPRAIVLLQVLLSKIQNTQMDKRMMSLCQALFLLASDRLNVLWAHPLGKNRPKQLTTPPVHEEMNLWLALTEAVNQWQTFNKRVELKYWPDMPSKAGGICLFKGRLRELEPKPDPEMINLVHASLPRRNQAWWKLSGLWTGWLWGKGALEGLRHSLIRQKYDWEWHATALEKVLNQVTDVVKPHRPVLLQVSEMDPKFLLASLLAAQGSGFRIRSYAANGSADQLQLTLRASERASQPGLKYWPELVRQAASEFLTLRSEPSPYLPLLTSIGLRLCDEQKLLAPSKNPSGKRLAEIERGIQEVLSDMSRFERFNTSTSFESGSFWLKENPLQLSPLADRTEAMVMQQIYRNHSFTIPSLMNEVFQGSRGLNSPEPDLTAAVIQSYAEPADKDKVNWRLRAGESLPSRNADQKAIYELITQLANKLNFGRELRPDKIVWFDDEGCALYTFFPITNAILMPLLLSNTNNSSTKLIIVPGSRANLIAFKLRRDPNLQRMLTADWHIIKYRKLRSLYETPLLTKKNFEAQLISDPPEYQTVQLHLL